MLAKLGGQQSRDGPSPPAPHPTTGTATWSWARIMANIPADTLSNIHGFRCDIHSVKVMKAAYESAEGPNECGFGATSIDRTMIATSKGRHPRNLASRAPTPSPPPPPPPLPAPSRQGKLAPDGSRVMHLRPSSVMTSPVLPLRTTSVGMPERLYLHRKRKGTGGDGVCDGNRTPGHAVRSKGHKGVM
jgi:hypothetical protein